jgi:small subunit ribosomal protein S8
MHHDPISDLVTRIRNATALKTDFVLVSCTNINCSILELFKTTNFIKTFKFIQLRSHFFILVLLSYNLDRSRSRIKSLRLISKPSLSIFTPKSSNLQNLISSSSFVYNVISTSYGILLSNTAELLDIGGKILFQIEIIKI